jgi:hypothetical protein
MYRAALHLTPCADSLLSHLAACCAGTGEVVFSGEPLQSNPFVSLAPERVHRGFSLLRAVLWCLRGLQNT